jgi:xylulose-5-phosphate/fructose-6-phosphate phosphoketolase
VFCVVGDGEAETGPLATSWHANKFINPSKDGAVLPILHLNGWKIANPTLLARIPEADLVDLLRGYGYDPHLVDVELGDNPAGAHQAFAAAMDACLGDVADIQDRARHHGDVTLPRWPMIVLRSPKGWTGPPVVDGMPVEGTFRAHQVPISDVRDNADHRRALEGWLRSYRPEELFDGEGRPVAELVALPPGGHRRMSANPVANGGLLVRDLELPAFRDYAVAVPRPGTMAHEATRVLGSWLRDVIVANPDNFLLFGPDEVASNRLADAFEVTGRKWMAGTGPFDDHLNPDGRVIEVLSERYCQGLLEGYLLTGRHGLFTCYEAFIHIIDSMFNQHAKWLEAASAVGWRPPIPSLNYLLTSHVWRQDHNGTTHQDPGFLDLVLNKKPDIVRVYLPPDANTLLSSRTTASAAAGT